MINYLTLEKYQIFGKVLHFNKFMGSCVFEIELKLGENNHVLKSLNLI